MIFLDIVEIIYENNMLSSVVNVVYECEKLKIKQKVDRNLTIRIVEIN